MVNHLIDNEGRVILRVGDEVRNSDCKFFIGEINESQKLCSIDKSKPWALLNDKSTMAKCILHGDYSASAETLSVV